jgi:hypothetical protein
LVYFELLNEYDDLIWQRMIFCEQVRKTPGEYEFRQMFDVNDLDVVIPRVNPSENIGARVPNLSFLVRIIIWHHSIS